MYVLLHHMHVCYYIHHMMCLAGRSLSMTVAFNTHRASVDLNVLVVLSTVQLTTGGPVSHSSCNAASGCSWRG
jgi:hypothetical protein